MQESELNPSELAVARRELLQCKEQLAAALDDAARFARALDQSHDRYIELSRRLDGIAVIKESQAEQDLRALLATKSFRWLQIPRRLWGLFHRSTPDPQQRRRAV